MTVKQKEFDILRKEVLELKESLEQVLKKLNEMEQTREKPVYAPPADYTPPAWDYIPPVCRNCSNHPSNGGSGICHCILGNTITY